MKVPSEEATALSRMADAAAAAAAFTAEGLRDDLHRPSQQAQRAELAKRAQQASDAVLRGILTRDWFRSLTGAVTAGLAS